MRKLAFEPGVEILMGQTVARQVHPVRFTNEAKRRPDRRNLAAGPTRFRRRTFATAIATLAGRWTGQTPRTPSALLPVPLDPRLDNHGCADHNPTLSSIAKLDLVIHLTPFRHSIEPEMDHGIKFRDEGI